MPNKNGPKETEKQKLEKLLEEAKKKLKDLEKEKSNLGEKIIGQKAIIKDLKEKKDKLGKKKDNDF